jgi:hypothetical protein
VASTTTCQSPYRARLRIGLLSSPILLRPAVSVWLLCSCDCFVAWVSAASTFSRRWIRGFRPITNGSSASWASSRRAFATRNSRAGTQEARRELGAALEADMNRLPAREVACCLGPSIRVHRIAFSKADMRREAAGARASISLVERCLADSGPGPASGFARAQRHGGRRGRDSEVPSKLMAVSTGAPDGTCAIMIKIRGGDLRDHDSNSPARGAAARRPSPTQCYAARTFEAPRLSAPESSERRSARARKRQSRDTGCHRSPSAPAAG